MRFLVPTPRRLLALAVVALLVGAVAWYAGARGSVTGIETAADDPAFAGCVDDAGISLAGVDTLDQDQEQRLWVEPGVLRCAHQHLGGDALAAALMRVTLSEDRRLSWLLGDTLLEPAAPDVQLRMVRGLAADLAADEGPGTATAAVARVLDARDAGDVLRDRLEETAAYEVVAAAGDDLGYADHLERQGLPDTGDALEAYLGSDRLSDADRERLDAARLQLSLDRGAA